MQPLSFFSSPGGQSLPLLPILLVSAVPLAAVVGELAVPVGALAVVVGVRDEGLPVVDTLVSPGLASRASLLEPGPYTFTFCDCVLVFVLTLALALVAELVLVLVEPDSEPDTAPDVDPDEGEVVVVVCANATDTKPASNRVISLLIFAPISDV
jgi:hypothetical protein